MNSVVITNNAFYVNHNHITNSYDIVRDAANDLLVVFPDSTEYGIFLDELEEEYGPVDLGAYCFGGETWDENALVMDELVNYLKANNIAVFDHR